MALVLTLGGLGCRSDVPRVHKRHLAVLDADALRGTLAVADDGETVAFAERTPDGQRVVRNGAPGAPYPETSAPQFSPAARRLFYWARDPIRPGLLLIVEGVEVATEFARPGALVFSADGRHWAVTGPVGSGPARRIAVLADGRELGRSADASLVTFSPDGAHVAHLARSDDNTVALVVDGAVRRTFTSPAGGSGALLALTPTDAVQSVVRYLSDGSLLVLARDHDAWVLLRDDARLGTFGDSRVTHGNIRVTHDDSTATLTTIAADALAVADDAPVVAWWERPAGPDERWRVVRDGALVDGITCASPGDSQPPLLSPDGRHIAYACIEQSIFGQDARVVVDGSRHGPYRQVWGLRFGDDGVRAAWGGADTAPHLRWTYYVNGRPYRLRFDEVWRPRLDAGGRHLAWQGRRGPRPQLGLDDGVLAAFDDVLWGPKFTAAGTAAWVIRRGRKVTRLDVTLP